MAAADGVVVVIGLGAFVLFLVLHVLFFRFVRSERLFAAILQTFAAGLGAAVAGGLWFLKDLNPADRVGCLALVLIVYGAVVFFYVLCFFGPYETSIRVRLVRELAKAKDGLLLQELLQQYNTAKILDRRLRRLTGSGDIAEENGKFYIKKKRNAFFAIDVIAQKMHAFIHAR